MDKVHETLSWHDEVYTWWGQNWGHIWNHKIAWKHFMNILGDFDSSQILGYSQFWAINWHKGVKIFSPIYSLKSLTTLQAIADQKMTTWNTISPHCWLVAMWWHHFATFDDIILQHLMTSFWMTCTFWILNKQVKNSFLKLCTIFHRSCLDLDLDLDVI